MWLLCKFSTSWLYAKQKTSLMPNDCIKLVHFSKIYAFSRLVAGCYFSSAPNWVLKLVL